MVGAGVAGICTAWELARAGLRVALLEADRVAAGVTGYTTAKLSAQHGLLYTQLRKSSGIEAARQHARSQQEAVEHVEQVAAELGIDCDLERLPSHTYMESPDAVDQLKAEADAAREAGLPASFVSDTGLPFPVAGAVRVDHQAQFHPRKYLLGLVADLVARGGAVHERTRIVSLHEGEPCRLTTEGGAEIVARDVVVATHYPVFDRALLFSRLEPHRELVIAAALPAEQDPHGMSLTQEQNTRSVRTTPYAGGGGADQRLLLVTGEKCKPGVGGVSERYERLAAWTTERFPDARITHRWAAQDNSTTDKVPFVGLFHPGSRHVYVATGFGGWGMSNGVMSGRLLSARITGEEALDLALRPSAPPRARGSVPAEGAGVGPQAFRGRPAPHLPRRQRRGDHARYGSSRTGRRAAQTKKKRPPFGIPKEIILLAGQDVWPYTFTADDSGGGCGKVPMPAAAAPEAVQTAIFTQLADVTHIPRR